MTDVSTTPGRPGLFVLSTPSPAAVSGFYRQLAGWDLAPDSASEVGGGQSAVLRAGQGGWLPYLAVPDLAATIARVQAAGGRVDGPVRTDPTGRSVIVVDSTDTPLGIQEVTGTGYEVSAEDGPIVWIEQKTRDQEAAIAFLADAFDLSAVGPSGPGRVRVLRGLEIPPFGGVMQFDGRWPPDYPAHCLLYRRTQEVDRDLEMATRHGGSVWFPPIPTPLGRLAYLRDPAGNALAVVEAAPTEPTPVGPVSSAAAGEHAWLFADRRDAGPSR